MKEKSCGAIIMRRAPQTEVLLVQMKNGGHYSFPKGHVEGDETEHETATREIFEETALSVKFLDGFRTVVSYSPKEGVIKDVVYFAAVPHAGKITPQEEEISSISWYKASDALALVTYVDDRSVLYSALNFFEHYITGGDEKCRN